MNPVKGLTSTMRYKQSIIKEDMTICNTKLYWGL